jgi:gamma-glutamyl hercynylcysteine S-oxide synthase
MTVLPETAASARHATAAGLAAALQSSRGDTLATFAVCERSLQQLTVPQRETLNPPLWELGHVGWFQEFWIARNPLRFLGAAADPDAARSAGVRPKSDALYDSSNVPHGTRWSLRLPDAAATRDDLARQLDATLAWLREAGDDDASLYFFRLALFHEDMHHEAALYMAQSLGLAIDDPRWQAHALQGEGRQLTFEPGRWPLGSAAWGFVFDNELAGHEVELPATRIDSRVLRWADFLPFVDAGGYAEPAWWSDAGAAWIRTGQPVTPRYLRREGAAWQQWRHGEWRVLDMGLPACHLTAFEAEAWCRWAGRRLPTEAEWERAAIQAPDDFQWGQVWEWTASPFLPYTGFEPHPYRDYSAPWFGSRRVLRGASFMTQPRMRHPRYRNFFEAGRNDVPAGFRSCRLP